MCFVGTKGETLPAATTGDSTISTMHSYHQYSHRDHQNSYHKWVTTIQELVTSVAQIQQ